MSHTKVACALELRGITKRYQDGDELRTVLDGVSLSVAAGEFVAVVGPSGSGKSTLLTIAGMLLSPDEGEVLVSGRSVSSLGQRAWTRERREHIGFVFQNHQLLPYLTAFEQVGVAAGKGRADGAAELLRSLGVQDSGQYPASMSGGERQRVAIARAFANDPDIILADEPTASLDAARGRQVVQLLAEQVHARGKAAVMVTHDERVLDLVDAVYELEGGSLSRRA